MIDFGVARAFGRVAHTSPGGLKGKIDYMSPEQASAEEVDHRADVFALGVVLWEALTGTASVPARDRARDDARDRRRSDPPSVGDGVQIAARARRRSSCARCASGRTHVSPPRTRWLSRWRRSRSSHAGFSPMQVATLHEVAVRAPSTCSGARRRPRRSISRSRSRPPERRRVGPERGAADRRPDDGVATRRCRGRTAAARCAARPAAAAAAAARARAAGQARRRASHSAAVQRRRSTASDGAQRGDRARSHLAVRGRGRAAAAIGGAAPGC